MSLRSMRPRASSTVQVCVDQSDSREGHQVETIIETKMIASDPGKRNLEQIASWRDLHHRSDREISMDIVVTVECEGEHSTIDCSRRESEVAAESPAVFVGMGQSDRYDSDYGQDSHQTDGTGPT